jgi:uncharacterized membrane protein
MVDPLEMVVAVYPEEQRAAEVYRELQAELKDAPEDIRRAAILVKKNQGEVLVQDPGQLGTGGGTVFGTLAGGPAGAVVGGAAGGVTGGVTSSGNNLGFNPQTLEGLKEGMPVNSSAILLVIERKSLDGVRQKLVQYQGKIYDQSLNESFASQLLKDRDTDAEE